MIKVSSVVKLNMPKIKQLTQVQATALEQTAEALHTEVVQAQVFPRDTGNLQNESTFVEYTLCTTPVFSSRVLFPERRKSKC